jgi:hypothetical protein
MGEFSAADALNVSGIDGGGGVGAAGIRAQQSIADKLSSMQ